MQESIRIIETINHSRKLLTVNYLHRRISFPKKVSSRGCYWVLQSCNHACRDRRLTVCHFLFLLLCFCRLFWDYLIYGTVQCLSESSFTGFTFVCLVVKCEFLHQVLWKCVAGYNERNCVFGCDCFLSTVFSRRGASCARSVQIVYSLSGVVV